jgi:hypothetical protein
MAIDPGSEGLARMALLGHVSLRCTWVMWPAIKGLKRAALGDQLATKRPRTSGDLSLGAVVGYSFRLLALMLDVFGTREGI